MRRHSSRLSSLALVAPILLACACGSDSPAGQSDTTGTTATTSADVSGTDTTDTTGDNPVFASLIGEWEIPCRRVGGIYFGVSRLNVTATSIENIFTSYTDSSCSAASKVIDVYVEDSAWSIGEPSGEGLALDMVLEEATVEISDAALQAIWDRESGCGPFTVGVVKDVSSMSCYGFWRPAQGATYYTIIDVQGDTFLFGGSASGDMKTEATRSTLLDRANVWQRVGATPGGGFIEGTIGGATYRAEENVAARVVQNEHIQLGATTQALTPWETWVVNVPNSVGTYACEDGSINAYLNFGFTEENLPVLWDTEQDGGGGCVISVTKAAPAVGDTIEGTFSGTLGDGQGTGHAASAGSFRLVRQQ